MSEANGGQAAQDTTSAASSAQQQPKPEDLFYPDQGKKPDEAPKDSAPEVPAPKPEDKKPEGSPADKGDPAPKTPEEKPKETPPPKEEPKPTSGDEPKFELKLPKDSQLAPEATDEVEAFAKAQKLSPSQAQAILERESNAVANFRATQLEQYEQRKNEWLEQSRKDPEFGGENFAVNAELAKRAVNDFASPGLKEELNKTGLGNHPELMRTFVKIGRAMYPDGLVKGGKPAASQSDGIPNTWYDHPSSKEK